mmetsp:Transcript_39862/g.98601  ORF Transcript_39862/g.98601 Transcript_39862/m.98601 type:complete len:317 (-) Transcript_39862:790-1740(-)
MAGVVCGRRLRLPEQLRIKHHNWPRSGHRGIGHWGCGHRGSGHRGSGHRGIGHWRNGHRGIGHWPSSSGRRGPARRHLGLLPGSGERRRASFCGSRCRGSASVHFASVRSASVRCASVREGGFVDEGGERDILLLLALIALVVALVARSQQLFLLLLAPALVVAERTTRRGEVRVRARPRQHLAPRYFVGRQCPPLNGSSGLRGGSIRDELGAQGMPGACECGGASLGNRVGVHHRRGAPGRAAQRLTRWDQEQLTLLLFLQNNNRGFTSSSRLLLLRGSACLFLQARLVVGVVGERGGERVRFSVGLARSRLRCH